MSVMTLATLSVGRAAGVIAVRQAVWFGVGLLALLTVASLDYRRLVRAAPALYLLGLVGLALVYVFGRSVSGARRWIVLGPLSVQPSELFKIAFVLMTVWVITSRWAQPAGRAKIAIGSGQLLGKGVAGATQSRLAFLPERHTDFVFAVFAETWGFVGCLALLTCYLLLLLRGFDIAASSREPVGRLVALGLTSLLAVQVMINVGMVTGLLPVVGIPLPLMSYGGSSMLASLVAIGLLLSVRMRQFQ